MKNEEVLKKSIKECLPEKSVNIAQWISKARIFFVASLYGSSGGQFLFTLFDSHPDVFTYPHWLQRYINFDNFQKYEVQHHLENILTEPLFFDTSLGNDAIFADGYDILGDNKDQGIKIDKKLFIEYMNDILRELEYNAENFTFAVIMAFNWAQGIYPKNNIFIIYTHDIHSSKSASLIFPTACLIATTRHPLNVFLSSVKNNRRKSHDRVQLMPAIRYDFLTHFNSFTCFSNRIGLIPLEELHFNPKQTMENLAQYMAISYHPSLLQSTISGLKWWGMRLTILNGFSKTLHQQVKVDQAGKNAEEKIFYATKEFQNFIGYALTTKESKMGFVRRYLPTNAQIIFYKDLWVTFGLILKKDKTFSGRVKSVFRLVKRFVRSFVVPFENIQIVRQCRRINQTMKFKDIFDLVAPLSSGALRVPEFRGSFKIKNNTFQAHHSIEENSQMNKIEANK